MHAHEGPTTEPPREGDEVEIHAIHLDSNEEVCSFDSAAFNWQQGARTQWVDENVFVFNDISDDGTRYVARTASVCTGDVDRSYNRPIQDGWEDMYYISLNYRRLRALRPDYGYFALPGLSTKELQDLDGDGLWRVDYESGNEEMIYSLRDVVNRGYRSVFGESKHYVNHVNIAPDGRRFVCLHRYLLDGKRFDRLLLGDPEGGPLEVLVDHDFVSHYDWVDSSTLLGYMRGPGGRDGYYVVDVETGEMSSLFSGRLDRYGDGHPHVQNQVMVTDTYPNKGGVQTLLLVNLEEKTVDEIAELHHGLQYHSEFRCDLHPRLSSSRSMIFFDSVFDGVRRLYAMSCPETEHVAVHSEQQLNL
jgi:hypothetical protein